MIIKYVKDTKTNRINQVVKGDYKHLINQVKMGLAVVSNEYELEQYTKKLSQQKQSPKNIKIINCQSC